jgi:small subunit ribosomal protein S5
MAKKETKNEPKDIIEAVPEEIKKVEAEILSVEGPVEVPAEVIIPSGKRGFEKRGFEGPNLAAWVPKTVLGKNVKAGKEKNIDEILEHGKRILEPEIVDTLLSVESDLLLIGQAKGKFGGGKRRAWRQTQKKTMEGNVLSFSAMAVVGDKKGHVGVGYGKARETLPAREKALRSAKLSIIKIQLGFESPENEPEGAIPHTIPYKVDGKAGSVRIKLSPAPRGTGLVTGDECKKILRLAGVKDVYSQTFGSTKTTFNLARACIDALKHTTEIKIK